MQHHWKLQPFRNRLEGLGIHQCITTKQKQHPSLCFCNKKIAKAETRSHGSCCEPHTWRFIRINTKVMPTHLAGERTYVMSIGSMGSGLHFLPQVGYVSSLVCLPRWICWFFHGSIGKWYIYLQYLNSKLIFTSFAMVTLIGKNVRKSHSSYGEGNLRFSRPKMMADSPSSESTNPGWNSFRWFGCWTSGVRKVPHEWIPCPLKGGHLFS